MAVPTRTMVAPSSMACVEVRAHAHREMLEAGGVAQLPQPSKVGPRRLGVRAAAAGWP